MIGPEPEPEQEPEKQIVEENPAFIVPVLFREPDQNEPALLAPLPDKKAQKAAKQAEKEQKAKDKAEQKAHKTVAKTLKLQEKEKKAQDKAQEKKQKTEQKAKKTQEKGTRKVKPPKNILDTSTVLENTGTSRSPTTMNNKIQEFRTQGIQVLENLPEKELAEMLKTANIAYYNTQTSLMTDNEYDIVKEYMERKYPKNTVLEQIGAPIEKNKVALPYQMWSMDKIKPDSNALDSWTKKYKGPYVLSCKLDGVSGMYSTEGDTPKLYTRGNGKVGQDVSHLLRVLDLPTEPGIVVRGEFIMQKAVFESKYAKQFANPRNLVSGIVNSKTVDAKARDLHFVVYEVVSPAMPPSEQMARLATLNHEVVQHKVVEEVSNEMLSKVLIDWRTNYEYEIDGVIVANDGVYTRKEGNPDHAFAFKMVISDQMAEVKVVDVLWNPSKSGYLKPRVRIEPVRLSGVTIEYATGFNGSFIETNKIGIGAVIQIIRSGDVIPHIKSVTTPAEMAKMPDVPYHWTDTHVDVVLDNIAEDDTVREKNITDFFQSIEVDGLSGGNVKRIIAAGFDSVPKILKMNRGDFEGVAGFKAKMVEKIHDGIRNKVAAASLMTIMAASNLFGRGIGERKLAPILEAYPDILTTAESPEKKVAMLREVKGIGAENARAFVENIPRFMAFLQECGLEGKLRDRPLADLANTVALDVDTSHPLYGKHIVMTKVRDKTIIEGLARVGGVLDDGITKTTFVLVVKSKEDVSNKTKYAVDHGIPIMTPAEFIAAYLQ